MAIEIERRFLTAGADWRRGAEASRKIRQAYLAVTPAASVRVRIANDAAAALTIKSGKAEIERAEFEYPIPVADAEELMAMRTGAVIEKQRYLLIVGGLRWEIDVFSGALAGLVIAEIELDDKDQEFERPDWLGEEITDDGRYANASLAVNGLPDASIKPGERS